MVSIRARRRPFSLVVVLASVAALGLGALAAAPASAQNANGGHPAHIHFGTCTELGEVAHALSNVGPGTVRNGVVSTSGRQVGQTEGFYPVDVSVTRVEVPLETLTGDNYAVNIHESADAIQNYIACGNIGGTQYGNTLIVGLGQLNDTGFTGIAVLRADGDTTVVTVYLHPGEPSSAAAATPAAEVSPTAAAEGDGAAAQAAAVSIAGFAFDAPSLQIGKGTTVTWTNNDGVPHTVTSDDGAFDSGPIAPGESYTFTFADPGVYAYHCQIHPSMTARVLVA